MDVKAVWLGTLIGLASFAEATPGSVDSQGCHGQGTQRHCHNSSGQYTAQGSSQLLAGVVQSNTQWLYQDGPANLFSGAGLRANYQFKSFGLAIQLDQTYHLSGDEASLTGAAGWLQWGPNLVGAEKSAYALAGYEWQTFEGIGRTHSLPAWTLGAGYQMERPQWTLQLQWRINSSDELESMWASLGAPNVSLAHRFDLGVLWRF